MRSGSHVDELRLPNSVEDDRMHRTYRRFVHAKEDEMAVTLHRCSNMWVKVSRHPCWRVEKALKDMGIEYTAVGGPLRRSKRDEMEAHTGQRQYPAIEFEDGTWYREDSQGMEQTIRAGKLMERATSSSATS
jgi:hypothetical protein